MRLQACRSRSRSRKRSRRVANSTPHPKPIVATTAGMTNDVDDGGGISFVQSIRSLPTAGGHLGLRSVPRRPTEFVCPNSDTICPNNDKIYLTIVTSKFLLLFFAY